MLQWLKHGVTKEKGWSHVYGNRTVPKWIGFCPWLTCGRKAPQKLVNFRVVWSRSTCNSMRVKIYLKSVQPDANTFVLRVLHSPLCPPSLSWSPTGSTTNLKQTLRSKRYLFLADLALWFGSYGIRYGQVSAEDRAESHSQRGREQYCLLILLRYSMYRPLTELWEWNKFLKSWSLSGPCSFCALN